MRRLVSRTTGGDRGFGWLIVLALGIGLGAAVSHTWLAVLLVSILALTTVAVVVSGSRITGPALGPVDMTDLPGSRQTALTTVEKAWVWLIVGLIPVTFLSGSGWVMGFRPSGLAWIALLGASIVLLLMRTIDSTALRYALPLSIFMALAVGSLVWSPGLRSGFQTAVQFGTVLVVYLLGSTLPRSVDDEIPHLRMLAAGGMVIAALVAVPPALISTIPSLTGSATRSVAIAVVPLYVVMTLGRESWTEDLVIGAFALGICLLTGSRTASVVVAATMLVSTALKQKPIRLAFLGLLVLAAGVVIVNSAAFKQRMFHSADGTLADILTLNPNFDTSGRTWLWTNLVAQCRDRPWLGGGFGNADALTGQITAGVLSQPHNDYLRLFCDTGMVGTLLFAAFLFGVSMRALRVRLSVTSPIERGWSVASVQLVVAMALFALSDNVLIYTAQYMATAALVFSRSDYSFTHTFKT